MKTPSRLYSSSSSITVILSAALLAPTLAAQENKDFTFSGYAEVGALHNSNLSVSEIETAAGQSGTAVTMDLGFDLTWKPVEKLNTQAGYSYSKNDYQDFDDYDLDLSLLYTDVSYDFDAFTLGSNYYLADADLGGDSFLQLNQYSFYVGKLFAEQWYLRGALNFTDKAFDQIKDRDADNEGFSTEVFWFSSSGTTSVMAGYTYEDETTRANPFSYEADTVRVRLTRNTNLMGKDSRLQLGYRVQNRDYAFVTPSIAEKRNDRQHVAEAKLEVSLSDWLELVTGVELADFSSNLDSADYSDNRVSLSMKASF